MTDQLDYDLALQRQDAQTGADCGPLCPFCAGPETD